MPARSPAPRISCARWMVSASPLPPARPSVWWAKAVAAKPPWDARIRLIEPTGGQIVFEGEDLTRLKGSALRAQRRKFQMIFQDPYGSLNPARDVENIIGEALDIHRLAPNARGAPAAGGEACFRTWTGSLARATLPARIQWRPAPAHRHRPRLGRGTEIDCLRRARQRPGCFGPGPNRQSAPGFAAASTASLICLSPTIWPWSGISAAASW